MTTLRVGMAGCGLIAGGPVRDGRPLLGNHADACRQVPDVELVAAADPDPARLKSFGRYWQVDSLHSDVASMLAAARLDLLIVATPAETHEAVCLTAAAAGVRGILCEKPFAGAADAARRICVACREAGVKLVVNFNRRWDRSHRELADRLANGAIGGLRSVWGCYTGTLRGNGSHLVDLLRMFVPGSWAVEWTSPLAAAAVDGPVAAVLRTENGVRAHLEPVLDADYYVFELEIFGTSGRSRLTDNGNDIRLDRPVPSVDYPGYRYLAPLEALTPRTMPDSFTRALAELADAVRRDQPASVAPEQFVDSLALLDAIAARAAQAGGR